MYKFPFGFDGAFLVGRTLELVCFSANQVYLHFDNHVKIVIESAFSYRRHNSGKTTECVCEVPVSSSDLMQLLEQKVTTVHADRDGNLTLAFANGDIVKCLATLPNYECYHIWNGDSELTI